MVDGKQHDAHDIGKVSVFAVKAAEQSAPEDALLDDGRKEHGHCYDYAPVLLKHFLDSGIVGVILADAERLYQQAEGERQHEINTPADDKCHKASP